MYPTNCMTMIWKPGPVLWTTMVAWGTLADHIRLLLSVSCPCRLRRMKNWVDQKGQMMTSKPTRGLNRDQKTYQGGDPGLQQQAGGTFFLFTKTQYHKGWLSKWVSILSRQFPISGPTDHGRPVGGKLRMRTTNENEQILANLGKTVRTGQNQAKTGKNGPKNLHLKAKTGQNGAKYGQKRAKNGQKRAKNGRTKPNTGKTVQNRKFLSNFGLGSPLLALSVGPLLRQSH